MAKLRTGCVALATALLSPTAMGPAHAEPLRFDVVAETLAVERADIRSAEIVWQSGELAILIRLSDPVAERFAELTAAHQGKTMQIVIESRIVTSAVIMETIAGGQIMLMGGFDQSEAKRILLLLTDPCPPGDTAKCVRRGAR